MTDAFLAYDALDLSELLHRGDVTPLALLEVVVQRIAQVNPQLNAVVHPMYEQARTVAEQQALGSPFRGVPFLLKDLFAEYQGVPLSEGSRAVAGYVSKVDTELVLRQKAAGLLIVGKTNASEFGGLPTTEPFLHGATANPWNPTLSPGGSSGGAAAAVAAGIVPMAHANDIGGSIRIPASCCGLFGLKPTRARNPLGPLFGDIANGLHGEHAVTRTVRDSAALLDATCGPDLGAPYVAPPPQRPFLEEASREAGRLRIGFLNTIPDGWGEGMTVHPDCVNAVQDAAKLCAYLGHSVEEIDPTVLDYARLSRWFGLIMTCWMGHVAAYWERELGTTLSEEHLEPTTWAVYQAGLRRTGKDYLEAIEHVQRFTRQMARWYHDGGYDVLLTPTMSIPPPPLGSFTIKADNPQGWARVTRACVVFTSVFNMTGQPAMSVPLWWNAENVPIGVQFAGRFGDEATLFRLAAQLEQTRPWSERIPLIHCSKTS